MEDKLFPENVPATEIKRKSPYQELLEKRTRPGLPENETIEEQKVNQA